MRICLDARNLGPEMAGVGRYILGLVPALARAAPGADILVLRRPSPARPISGGAANVREIVVDAPDDTLGHALGGARILERVFAAHGAPDIYHSLFHLLPGRPLSRPAAYPRVVATVHDLMWIERPFACTPGWRGVGTWLLGRAVARGLRRADALIAVSEATRLAIAVQTGIETARVIHHGVEERFFLPAPPLPGRFPIGAATPYVVAIGNSKPYKNLAVLVRAFARATGLPADTRLVLVGDCRGLAGVAREAGILDRTVFTGPVGEADVAPLLGHARLFVMPSLREGFGLPVVEAMALGVPAAVADIEPLGEVAGDAALRFDPRDEAGLSALISRLLGDTSAATEWGFRARARAEAFRWDRTARRTLAVYEELTCA